MSSVNTNRIAKNTLFLYLRLFLTMLINLYTSRIVLNALGVEQFGIYNVVGGVVAFFSFLQGSLTASTQRFLNFEMGKPKYKQDIAKVFSTSLLIHYAIAVICLLLVEPIGFWFVSEKLNIASNYLSDTIWVFHFSVLTLLITLVSIPYNALIIEIIGCIFTDLGFFWKISTVCRAIGIGFYCCEDDIWYILLPFISSMSA